jgi:hypothetical protein
MVEAMHEQPEDEEKLEAANGWYRGDWEDAGTSAPPRPCRRHPNLLALSVGADGQHDADKEGRHMLNKAQTIDNNRIHDTETGSNEVQIALMTERIKMHKKDHHSRRMIVEHAPSPKTSRSR